MCRLYVGKLRCAIRRICRGSVWEGRHGGGRAVIAGEGDAGAGAGVVGSRGTLDKQAGGGAVVEVEQGELVAVV
jgi:hypothetical protein